MAPRDTGDDKTDTPAERPKSLATLADLTYVYPYFHL